MTLFPCPLSEKEKRLNRLSLISSTAIAVLLISNCIFHSAKAANIEPPALSNSKAAVAENKTKDSGKTLSTKTKEEEKSSTGIQLPVESPSLIEDTSQLLKHAEEAAMRAAAEEAKREEEFIRKSYEKAERGILPLSPDQVRSFMHRLESTQEAAQAPFAGPPKGEVKVMSLSLDPGGEPPQVNLAAGYITTISMVDATGAPWPILDVGVGGNFEVTPTQAGSHVIRVTPLTRLGNGNLSVLLKDLSTPIIFRLVSGGSSFHMRYDARVPKLGPNAKTPIIERGRVGPVAGDQLIAMILENAPPKEAKRLKVTGLDARTMAWKVEDKIFVRTPLSLLSPAWNASASSPDGMNVYEIGDAPVLLMSDNGIMMRARLMREEDNGG